MMKKLHRILIVAACVLLAASMASPAFAATQVLYRGTMNGYDLVGTGYITDDKIGGGFQATCNDELSSTFDPECFNCKIIMIVYSEDYDELHRQTSSVGNLWIGVSVDLSDVEIEFEIEDVYCIDFIYYFCDSNLGRYTLYAD